MAAIQKVLSSGKEQMAATEQLVNSNLTRAHPFEFIIKKIDILFLCMSILILIIRL